MNATEKKSAVLTADLQIAVKVDVEDLKSAIESGMIRGPHGYGYWCDRVTIGRRAEGVSSRYIDEEIASNVLAGGTAIFDNTEDDDEETLILTREMLFKGFSRWVVEFGAKGEYDEKTGITHFEIDAPSSDAIIQFALFGEQRYG